MRRYAGYTLGFRSMQHQDAQQVSRSDLLTLVLASGLLSKQSANDAIAACTENIVVPMKPFRKSGTVVS